jgi:hypothetical protein
MQLTPANNVIFAFVGGLLATVLLHIAKQYGYVPGEDIASALPAGIALFMAHAWDVYTGDNKKPANTPPVTTP